MRRSHIPFCCLAIAIFFALAARAADPALQSYQSKYYLIRTDLPEIEAREAQLRMTRMAQEYIQRTNGFAGRLKDRLPFELYKNLADYTKAVGVEGSGGYFDGEKLMAATLRADDGSISPSTWHIVQHEGFHQFAKTIIGGDIPMWADEGLAEYYGEAHFTGDGFVTGLIPQPRLVRLRALLLEGDAKPFAQFLTISREQWNAKVEMKNYDQAWSLVHFLLHGEDGKLQKPFDDFLHDIAKGEAPQRSLNVHLGETASLERRYRAWWLSLAENPTSQAYARATLSILTSFLARSHLQNQSFPDFESFLKTPASQFKQPNDNWLPPTLLTAAIADAQRLQADGDKFSLIKSDSALPSLLLTQKSGGKLSGKFTLSKDNRLEVQTEIIAVPPKTNQKN